MADTLVGAIYNAQLAYENVAQYPYIQNESQEFSYDSLLEEGESLLDFI